jgi:glycerol-3-phosphate acyltransferase PlsY
MLYETIYREIGFFNLKLNREALFVIQILLCTIIPYLLGSINTAIIISKKVYKQDIRDFGSGNAGMTNMHRTYGTKAALLTLAGDCGKQIVSIFFASFIYGREGAYLAGMFCMLGHIAPIYYKFKGGKGVLTAATLILFLNPVVFVVVFAIFVIVVALSRFISLGSILSAFAYPGILYMYMQFEKNIEGFPMVASTVIAFVVIFMHRSNISRLANGKENKLCLTKKQKEQAERDRLMGMYNGDEEPDPDELDEETEYVDTTGIVIKNDDQNESSQNGKK